MDHKSRGLLRSPPSSPESPTLPSVSADGKARVDTLLERVDSILPSEDLPLESQKSCVAWFQEACTDCDTYKYASQRLHHYWLSNRPAVTKAASFLKANWMAEVGGLKLRNEILSILEEDFHGRQSMQAKSPERFLNAVAFLVEIFIRIRLEKLPYSVLTPPVFDYLDDLLTGDESEIKLLAHLVIGVTPTLAVLQEGDAASLISYSPLQTLFSKVRSTLMSRNLSSVSRLWLLLIVDVSSSGVLKLPSLTLQAFYKNKVSDLCSSVRNLSREVKNLKKADLKLLKHNIHKKDHLGTDVDGLLKSLEHLHPCEGKNAAETIPVNHSGSNLTSSIPDLKDDVDVNHQVQAMKISEKTSYGTKKKSPAMMQNEDKRENFRSALQVENKGSKGKSYWLHDDRFDNEDTYTREKKSETLTKPRASQSNWRRPSNQRSDKDSSPKSNNGNWRQSSEVQPIAEQSSAVLSSANVVPDLVALSGHVNEENWED